MMNPPVASTGPQPPAGQEAEVCRDFQRGFCRRGDKCYHLHIAPNPMSSDAEPKQVCRDFQRGFCARGERCFFLHVPPALMPGVGMQGMAMSVPGMGMPGMGPSGTRQLCRDFGRGQCSRGVTCPFLHLLNGKEICRNYNRPGGCNRGTSCAYVHVSISGDGDQETGRKRQRTDGVAEADDKIKYYDGLTEENILLRKDNASLRQENASLREEIDRLKERLADAA